MGRERRDRRYIDCQRTQLNEDDVLKQAKSFEIPKQLVWQSYLAVKANRGAPGCDGQTMQAFDENRNANLYKIWNRLSSGCYFPPPVLEKRIPKDNGKERVLGIPTIADRIAQGAIKQYVESYLEPVFHPDSYGYRPNKSAHHALAVCKERCWQYNWVLEVDIRAFFDQVRHDLVLKALAHHKMPNWVMLYCQRWLEAPMQQSDGHIVPRTVGTPQGGVISPLLANLFLHYAFDTWIGKVFKGQCFERYADDIVIHCRSMREATKIRAQLKQRLESVGLALNEEKSKIVYIDTYKRYNVETSFTFLGYDFKVRTVKNKKGQLFRTCMPGASKKAMKKITQVIKSWKMHRAHGASLLELAQRYNRVIRGWIEYYGQHWYRNFGYHLWRVLQSRLLKWMKMKYRINNKQAQHRLKLIRKEKPRLFAHWYLLRTANE